MPMKRVSGMDARLSILSGPSSGQIVPIPAGTVLVGREKDCHLRFPDEFVSRHHCVLLLDEHALRIRDLGSKNGTFVNSRRIGAEETTLLDGDIVSFGEILCQINLVVGTTHAKPPIPEERLPASPQAPEPTLGLARDTVHVEGFDAVPPTAEVPPPPPVAPPAS